MRKRNSKAPQVFAAAIVGAGMTIGFCLWLSHDGAKRSSADHFFEHALPAGVAALNTGDAAAIAQADDVARSLPDSVRQPAISFLAAMRYAATATAAQEPEKALGRAARELNRATAAAGVAYYVDTELMPAGERTEVVLFIFRITGATQYTDGNRTFPILHARRKDQTQWRHTLVAYTTDKRDHGVVVLNRVEWLTDKRLLPLKKGALLWNDARHPSLAKVSSSAAAQEIGAFSRAELIEALTNALGRHEAQHLFDRGRLKPVSGMSRRAWAETSAYLAEIAREKTLPRTHLALLTEFLVSQENEAEGHAARRVLAEIARELGWPKEPPGVIAERLFATAPDTVRTAASAAWQRLFATALPPLEAE